jgi:hypothetical protein
VKVIELLAGGLPLSVAQTVMRLVVLPCSQSGIHLKTPSTPTMAPAGAFDASGNETGPFPLNTELVTATS